MIKTKRVRTKIFKNRKNRSIEIDEATELYIISVKSEPMVLALSAHVEMDAEDVEELQVSLHSLASCQCPSESCRRENSVEPVAKM